MRLLHGSYTEILTPNLTKCKGKNDFGKGFYLTPNWKRAWQMGKRSTFLHGGKITVNAFLFYPNIVRQCGEAYLDESNLSILVSRISQFGLSYIQYCFCTQKAINELIKD